MKKLMAVIMAILIPLSFTGCKKEEETEEVKSDAAEKQAVETVYTGVLEANRETKVLALSKGQIMECPYEIGDYVQEGALIYRMDDNGISDSIKTTKNAIEKSILSLSTAAENADNLKVYAPADGILTNFTIKNGERINSGEIGRIVDQSKITATVPFSEAPKT
ncbi:MAG: hypothetical protein ACI4SS_02470, partial [Clostridia bacterium]